MNKDELLKESAGLQDQLVTDRRWFHTHPGTGFDIADTVAYVSNELKDMGYEVHPCGKAGLTVLAGGKKPGKVFMIRGDMDALPIKEESGVEYASQNGKMHACGHDLHTSMMLGAARLLKAHEDEICGTIKLDFQPAEEIFEGADDMLKNGLLENPKVDAALMIHVMAGLPMPTGMVLVCDGGVSAPAADYFNIHIQGTGCHGSMPNMGVDPITVAAHIITALQEIHARELALTDQAVLTIGSIHGGKAANAIPDTVDLDGTIRTYDEETRALLKKRMEEICGSVAAAFRATAAVNFGSGCPTLLNNQELSVSVTKYAKELLPGMAYSMGELMAMSGGGSTSKTAGSEDFAYVSQQVPSIMLALAAGQPKDGHAYPQHHPKVTFDEKCLSVGSAVYAYTAMRWLEEHSS